MPLTDERRQVILDTLKHCSADTLAAARTEAELGPLTLAVNAAGIANANPAEEMEESQFQTMMDINLKGVFLSCQAEANAMLKNGRGAINVAISAWPKVLAWLNS